MGIDLPGVGAEWRMPVGGKAPVTRDRDVGGGHGM
jgi:hypothetical protein